MVFLVSGGGEHIRADFISKPGLGDAGSLGPDTHCVLVARSRKELRSQGRARRECRDGVDILGGYFVNGLGHDVNVSWLCQEFYARFQPGIKMLILAKTFCRFLGTVGLTVSILLGIPCSIVIGALLAGMDYWHGPPVYEEMTARQVKYAFQLGMITVLPSVIISSLLLFLGCRKSEAVHTSSFKND